MARLSCGIVGLPNVGKSTLFNALTRGGAASSNYPFCTIDPNVGVVDVPDGRLAVLSKISKSQKLIPAVMEFVDIAGLVEGASKGEGLGNKFLANIRETDAIVHVVRCFEGDDVVHVSGQIDPIADMEVVSLELILADIQMVENSLGKVARQAKGNKEMQAVLNALQKVSDHLNKNLPVCSCELSEDEWELLGPYPFLSAKKVLYACNISEDDVASGTNEMVERVRAYAENENNEVITFCAKLEEELSQFEGEEQAELLDSMGLKEPGLNRLIKQSFHMLGLMTYLTTGEQETRAWTVERGSKAPHAAGKIHSDIEKGFIRAEVVPFEVMVKHNGRNGAREAGLLKAEGKDYEVQDGDVILFLHS